MKKYSLYKDSLTQYHLSGVVNFFSAADIVSSGYQLFTCTQQVVLSLRNIDGFDSSIVSVLLSWQRFCNKNNIKFAISCADDKLAKLLQSYHVKDLFDYFD